MPFRSHYITYMPVRPSQMAPLWAYMVALGVGISAAWWLKEQVAAWWWLIALAAVGVAEIAMCFKGMSRQFVWLVALLLTALTGGSLLQSRYENMDVSWPSTAQYYEGRIVHIQKRKADAIVADVEIDAAAHARYKGRKVRLYLEQNETASDAHQVVAPMVGHQVSFYGNVHTPVSHDALSTFDYRSYLLTHGITGTAYMSHSAWKMIPSSPVSGLRERLLSVRNDLLQQYAHYFQGDHLALLSALSLGDKSQLTDSFRAAFTDTGTSHFLALSGLHLAILYCLLQYGLLRWFKRKRAIYVLLQGLSLIAIWLFVGMVGAPLSLQRAAFMFSVVTIGQCFSERGGHLLNNVSLAAIVLLLWSPMSLFDVGFQLSFSAVLGIALLSYYVWERYRLPLWDYTSDDYLRIIDTTAQQPAQCKWKSSIHRHRVIQSICHKAYDAFRKYLYPFITVTLSTQIGTLPFVLYYFHQFTPYALLANFAVIPAAYVLLLGAVLFCFLPIPVLRSAIALVLGQTMTLLQSLLTWMSGLPFASIHWYPSVTTLLACCLFPLPLYLLLTVPNNSRRIRRVGLAFLFLTIGVSSEMYRTRDSRVPPQYIVHNVKRATVLQFFESADRSYLFSTQSADTTQAQLAYVARTYFRPNGIAAPQWVGQADYEGRSLLHHAGVYVFGREIIVSLHHNVRTDSVATAAPQSIATLIVGRGCYADLDQLLQRFRPQMIVLAPSLPFSRRSQLAQQCQAKHYPYHDVATQGAYVHPL